MVILYDTMILGITLAKIDSWDDANDANDAKVLRYLQWLMIRGEDIDAQIANIIPGCHDT